MKTCINSEFGKLEGVIIHQPGSEVENMTPENAERALYSDILNLSIASKEFAQLEGVLKSVTSVFYVKKLLSDILGNESVKMNLLKEICNSEGNVCNPFKLAENKAVNLANLLIEGVVLEKNNLTNYLSNERFLLRPLHNLFFTRDPAMGMNDQMLIGKMANPVRERETLIMEAIFNNHPAFETSTLNPAKPKSGIAVNPKSTLEGGDFQVARENVFVIGTGVRTSTQGIDFIIENIKQLKSETQHIIVQELPSTPESFIHLDMVFTFLNTDSCMIYEPVITKMNRLRTIHIQIKNRKVTKIEENPNILAALQKVGIDLKPVFCGSKTDSWIQEREQWHSGANFFAFAPGKVIGYERNSHTIDELNNNGFEVLKASDVIEGKISVDDYKKCVVLIAGSELARGGGGARCMTMPVRRSEINW
ncbi:MAG TPA: arginine deiminase family protein [Draconibacterium sp.]|nr:arginine deiminase family protein [Draconibacterium sp.]